MLSTKELIEKCAPDFANWSKAQREYLIRTLEEAQDHRHDALRDLYDADYVTKPATIQEFLMDPDLLGLVTKIKDWDDDDPNSGQDLYPFWKHELADLFAPDKNYQQWVVSAGIGAGKSFCAVVALLYKVYLLLCMRNPQDFCGLANGTPIVFGFFSATKVLSNVTEHRILTGIMETSPFFKRTVGVTDNARPHELLRLPHNILFAFGSRAVHALGQNLIGGLMDEAAFGILTGDRQMTELFDGIWRRLVSRYSNSPSPGLLILASSKSSQTDFLEKHIQRWATAENAGLVKLTKGALYTIKPHQFVAKDTFKIMIGDEVTPSRILADGELPDPGFAIEEVPDHPALRSQFNADLEGALRDISAICVANESPLIPLRETIIACIDPTRQHPFKSQTVFAGTRDSIEIEHLFDYQKILLRRVSGWVPRINAGIHVTSASILVSSTTRSASRWFTWQEVDKRKGSRILASRSWKKSQPSLSISCSK